MRLFITATLLLSSFVLLGAEVTRTFTYESYELALGSTNKIVFEMESTKGGFITTGFTGVVKTFDLKFSRQGATIEKGTTLSFLVASMDTDVDGRNEKMYNKCFSYKEFPSIKVVLNSAIEVDGKEKSIAGTISVRGVNHPLFLKIKAESVGPNILVTGSTQVTLSALKIPDPSIWIASVRDMVEIKFSLMVQ
jgi:polyisoprenoid-binding protein YceI